MALTTARGTALYVGALLGPGLLVLPGLASAAAGPASIVAWAGLLVISGLVAIVFARFGVTRPSVDGVAAYATWGLHRRAGRAAGWCFLAGIVAGAPVVCYLGAGYLGRGHVSIAAGLLVCVLAVTLLGVRASTGFQMTMVTLLLAVIVVAIAGGLPAITAANWTPFAPHGWSAIGRAAAVLMLSFIGWEAVAPLTDRFADPKRQLPIVIGAAFAITTVIYLALAATTIGALGPAASTGVPITALLTLAFGPVGKPVAAIAALLLTFGAVNAYVSGGAALARSLTAGRDHRWFYAAILGSAAVMLPLVGTGRVDATSAVAVSTACFLVVYLLCMLAAARLFPGGIRWAAVASTAGIAAVLVASAYAALPAVAVAAIAAWANPKPRSRRTGAASRKSTSSAHVRPTASSHDG